MKFTESKLSIYRALNKNNNFVRNFNKFQFYKNG